MYILLIALLGMVLAGSLAATVLFPGVLQRAIAMIFSLAAISLIAYSGILLKQKESEVWNYGRNIRPTKVILSLLSEDVQAGRYDRAKSNLDLMQDRWKKVRARPDGYSASDILREMQSSRHSVQTNPKSSD